MQVILKKDIPELGRIGEVIKVRSGYARNYLIPRGLGLAASSSNAKMLAHQKKLVDLHKKKIQKDSEQVAKKMDGVKLSLKKRVNEAKKLFGSIGPAEIAEELASKKYTVDRRDIEMEAIKAPGDYKAKVRLPGDVYVEIDIVVEALEEKEKKSAAAKGSKTKKAASTKKSTKTKAAKEDETEESAEETEE